MTAITLRGLWTRKLRAGLTALAVLLGVMMISGTYVFTDTINHSFDRIFDTANKGVDIKVVPHKTVDAENVEQPPFSESLLSRVRAAQGVAKAAGGVNDTATIFDTKGKRTNKGGAPALLFSASPEPFNPLTYVEGGSPANAGEVTLDQNTADRNNFKVGQTVLVGGKLPAKRYRISGIG
jgi:putative ABC transport system permease protein